MIHVQDCTFYFSSIWIRSTLTCSASVIKLYCHHSANLHVGWSGLGINRANTVKDIRNKLYHSRLRKYTNPKIFHLRCSRLPTKGCFSKSRRPHCTYKSSNGTDEFHFLCTLKRNNFWSTLYAMLISNKHRWRMPTVTVHSITSLNLEVSTIFIKISTHENNPLANTVDVHQKLFALTFCNEKNPP